VEGANLRPIMAGFRLPQRLLQAGQFFVAGHDVVDRSRIRRWSLLSHMGDNPAGRAAEPAGVGPEIAQEQGEQAGLAAAIGTGQTDLLPGENR